VVAVSAVRGDGVPELLASLGTLLSGGTIPRVRSAGPADLALAVANRRHAEALERARAALARARAAAAAGEPGEIVALELRESLAAVGEVTGETVSEDVLERIFSRFCIGK
jgi:tRNA modification GTPase